MPPGGGGGTGGHIDSNHSLWDPLVPITSFKYLGRVLVAADDEPEVFHNLQQARQKWVHLTRVLRR